ncbi:unnamed protein product [Owenia fusiformis]|uniref:Glycosyltransferase 2-like domain-containing protein n=1 Tax=Owenia fusiformis TaxID=6347 RepID=A0A8J1U7H7_OWEFU|nr:unnamed protein product [Owenia fusiformis]
MNRLDLVKRMIESVWNYYPKTQVIVVDDYYKDYLADVLWQEFLTNHSIVDYVQLGENAGISHGREIGVSLVTTKYFMQIDDDFVFTDNTNLTKLIDVLETTDLSIVTGDYKNMMFTGILKVHQNIAQKKGKQTMLYHFPETAHGLIPGFKNCYSVDLGPNIYLANTEHIRYIKPWDRELKAQEHTDFFLVVLIAGLKVGACTDVPLKEYGVPDRLKTRAKYPKKGVYIMNYLRKWKITEWFKQCSPKQYYSKEMDNGKCKWNSTYQFFDGDPNILHNILIDRN